MRTGRPFRCNIPAISVQVSSDGRVWACEPRIISGLEPYGHFSELDFKKLVTSAEHTRVAQELASCNSCLLPCVANVADSLPKQAFRKLANRLV